MSKPHIYDLDYSTFYQVSENLTGAKLTADVWHYLYHLYAAGFSEMVTLPKAFRTQLEHHFSLTQPECIEQVISEDGNTRKDLLVFEDGQSVEVVLLRYRQRFSACISTQIGCACGCRFCATGQMGFIRQLSAGEIVAQVIYLERLLKSKQQKLSNVVLMGMGEPLLNYDATISAVQRLTNPRGLAISPRRITLSTVGIPQGIRKLAGEKIPIKLALSLHAATDALRETIMPINRHYPLSELHDALSDYTAITGKRVFLEWTMIKGINDMPEAAKSLVSWVENIPVHVNLIRLNTSSLFPGESSTDDVLSAFASVLDEYQIPHTVRQSRGLSISAGCGQLRSYQNSKEVAVY